MTDRDQPTNPEHIESTASANDGALAEHLDIEGLGPDAADDVIDDAAGDDLFAASPTAGPPATTPRVDLVKRARPVPAEGEAEQDSRRRRPKKPRKKAPWWELPLLIAIAIGIAVLVKTFVIQPFYIPSQSMEKTLHGCPGCSGDRILVFKPVYDVRDPHPGDIVVFDAPPGWNEGPPPSAPSNPVVRAFRTVGQFIGFIPPDDLVLVKRVIAVGGQTVRGHSDAAGHDVVQVSDHGANGPWRTLKEPFVYQDGPDPRATFGPVTIPKGRLWVMGDHRNDSADSRFHCGSADPSTSCDATSSTVPISDVIGKAVIIAWPPSRWRTLGTPATFTSNALPALGGAATALPIWFVRRRRRRRPGRAR